MNLTSIKILFGAEKVGQSISFYFFVSAGYKWVLIKNQRFVEILFHRTYPPDAVHICDMLQRTVTYTLKSLGVSNLVTINLVQNPF